MDIPGWRYDQGTQSYEYSDGISVIVLYRISNTEKINMYRVLYYFDNNIEMEPALLTGQSEQDVKNQAIQAMEEHLNSVKLSLSRLYSSLQMAKHSMGVSD